MRYRRLGNSDLHVSEIAMGSWLTFGTGVERAEALRCLDLAFGAGVNFVDTANVYGHGAAEAFLGEALAGRPRDSYVLATKLFFPMTDTDRGLSAAQIEKQLDASLKRLGTDHIDLYQCHRHDPDTPLEETMEALTRAVESGKVRWLGFSEWPVEQVRAAIEMAGAPPPPPSAAVPLPEQARGGIIPFVSSQPQYSLLWRRPEKTLIPLCAANGISQIVWSPLAQGVLTGKYAPGRPPPAGSRATSEEMGGWMEWLLRDDTLAAVERLKPIAAEAGLSLAQFALAWVLREPNVASAIVGASRPEQVDDNAAASGAKVDPALFAEAERIVAAAMPEM